MRYKSIRVVNFRSIRDSGVVELDPKMTVIVGANNSGKSSVLDAIKEDASEPHLSPSSVQFVGSVPPESRFEREIAIDKTEIEEWVSSHGRELYSYAHAGGNRETASVGIRHLLTRPPRHFELRSPIADDMYPGVKKGTVAAMRGVIDIDRGKVLDRHDVKHEQVHDLLTKLMSHCLSTKVVRIKAERFGHARGSFGTSKDAGANSERLASAMHCVLTSNRPLFQRIVEEVTRIVPSITDITVPNVDGSQVELRVWMHDPSRGREDLAIPINKAGTGVWQVVALVHALLTAERPKVFLIDEPNNYLHPRAVLDLVRLLRSQSMHQHVVATHSPEVISACDPGVVYRASLSAGESAFARIDPSDVSEQRRTLVSLGFQLSSFFGADEVLWVEGPTEEAVLPMVLSREVLSGLKVLHVHDTGAFDSKDSGRIPAVYERLVSGIALIPPAVGFLFDREGKKDSQIETLSARLGGKVAYTKRRLIECYFLDAAAIAETINSDMEQYGQNAPFIEVTSDRVEATIRDLESAGKTFLAEANYEDREAWLATVHAAKLLTELFNVLTECQLTYDKRRHGPMIVERMLTRDPEALAGLRAEVESLLERGREALRPRPPESRRAARRT